MGIEQSRYIQHLRSEIMNSKEEAIIKLQDMMSAINMERADGVQLISRYRSNDKIISLVGIVAVDENNNSDITIVNAEDAYVTKDEFETAINELKEQINNNSGSTDNTEEKDEFGSGYDIDNDYWIHCEYDITNISEETSLLTTKNNCTVNNGSGNYEAITKYSNEHLDNILSMKIDNIEIKNPIKSFKFNSLGKHTVDFLLKETTSTLPCMFYEVKRLCKIILPFTIEKIEHNTFNTCSNLKLIQLNCYEAPVLGSYAFKNINNDGTLIIRDNIDYTLLINKTSLYNEYKIAGKNWKVSYITASIENITIFNNQPR